jgi:hypothetical protein
LLHQPQRAGTRPRLAMCSSVRSCSCYMSLRHNARPLRASHGPARHSAQTFRCTAAAAADWTRCQHRPHTSRTHVVSHTPAPQRRQLVCARAPANAAACTAKPHTQSHTPCALHPHSAPRHSKPWRVCWLMPAPPCPDSLPPAPRTKHQASRSSAADAGRWLLGALPRCPHTRCVPARSRRRRAASLGRQDDAHCTAASPRNSCGSGGVVCQRHMRRRLCVCVAAAHGCTSEH